MLSECVTSLILRWDQGKQKKKCHKLGLIRILTEKNQDTEDTDVIFQSHRLPMSCFIIIDLLAGLNFHHICPLWHLYQVL